ncbi:hypothetical protein Tco_1387490 [Tanacetum coccineum]
MNKLLSYVTVTRGLKAYQSPNAKELQPNPKTPSLSGSECLNPRPFPGEKRVLDLSPSKSSNSSWPLGWSLRSVGLPHGIRGLVEEGERFIHGVVMVAG